MQEIIFINSHPIQYFAPLYKFMNEHGLKTKAWYCTEGGLEAVHDKEFGVNVKWDIPILEGYTSRFFKNYSWKPAHSNGFFGLINLGMILELFKIPKSVIVVHGWHYFTHLSILMIGKICGHTVCLRCEMPNNQEILKTGWKQVLKRMVLKYLLFPRISRFLYIGTQNKLFYKSYNLPDDKLLFCPYSVDDARFKEQWEKLSLHKTSLKQRFGIPVSDKIILYSGKYIDKKRPIDIIKAFIKLDRPDCWLIMVGEGELRPKMETLILQNQLKKVILTGFVNQSNISEYYAVSDVFVMCSEIGETWGLSVNEAMNFNLPVIVSDLTGCSQDLVQEGVNGYIFKTGDTNELTLRLKQVLVEKELLWSFSSQSILKKFSYSVINENLKSILN